MKIRYLVSVFILMVITTLFSCMNDNIVPTISFEQQLVNDTTAIEKYLTDNSISHYKDASGLRFVIVSLGSGFPPRIDNEVKVTYSGNLLTSPNGQPFDAGNADGVLSSYIVGWQIGLALLPRGSKAVLYIPSGYAYGNVTTGTVPANSNLIFNVDLTDVITTTTEQTQLASDVAVIDSYIATNSIAGVVKDTTGLRYVITTTGTGATPTWLSKVSITYTGKLLTSGITFYTGTNVPSAVFDSRVVNYIRAFQVGLQKMPAGSAATFYVPSGLAFGSQGTSSGDIPPNANLIYQITLSNVSN